MPAEILGGEKVNSKKDYLKHTGVYTGGRDRTTTTEKRERGEGRFTSSAKQWSNITKQSINNIHNNPGSEQICVRNSQQLPCAFYYDGLNLKYILYSSFWFQVGVSRGLWAVGGIFRNKISIKEISLFIVTGTYRVKKACG